MLHTYIRTVVVVVGIEYYYVDVLTIRGSDVLIINSTFDKNLEGGVILALQGSNVSLIANEFSRNSLKKGVKPNKGSAVHIEKSELTLTENIFANNMCTSSDGGAIYAYLSNVTMTGPNVFVNNSAIFGGAVSLDKYSTLLITDRDHETHYHYSNTLSLQAGTIWFVNNTANGYGGGAISVASESKLLVLLNRTSMTFEHNVARNAGGAIKIFGSQATFVIASDLKFNGNRASRGGAIGIHTCSADVNISTQAGQNITFTTNTANEAFGYGDAIYVSGSNLTLANCTFSQNRAGYGGAIYSDGVHRIIMKGTMQFMHNSAEYGGAVAGFGFF